MTTGPAVAAPLLPPLSERVRQKIEESKYFYDQMASRENVDLSNASQAEQHYRFYASAFLNSVRSPLQYIYEELKTDPAKKTWYDTEIAARPVLAFIRDERNSNIHTMSTRTIATHVVKFDIGATHEMHQEWPSYTGTNKRVTAVAQDAIEKVQEIVDDGIARGYII